MSDYYDDPTDENGPKALRDHAKKLEKELADLKKSLEDERQARAEAEKKAKSASLADLLRDAKVDPKFARLASRDEVEPTKEAVAAWIEENKDFYSFTPKQEATAETTAADEPQGQPNIPEGMEDAVRASQALDASGVAPSDVTVINKLQSIKADHTISEDQLLKELADAGVELG